MLYIILSIVVGIILLSALAVVLINRYVIKEIDKWLCKWFGW